MIPNMDIVIEYRVDDARASTTTRVRTLTKGDSFSPVEVAGVIMSAFIDGITEQKLSQKMSRVEVEHEIEEAIAADREERKLWNRFMNWLRPGRNDF